MKRIHLISVTKKGWGPELPKSLSAMANELLTPKGAKWRYRFTGKHRPKLDPGETLVFRFEGKLLGEAKFLEWSDRKQRCMVYTPIERYRERIIAQGFVSPGANPYPIISDATIRRIRSIARKAHPGPYPKTGETESIAMHRIGQGKVRESALDRYGRRCCLCGIDEPQLLIAGHIRGWAKGKRARSNPSNVVLMCAFHDSLFGRGFITLDPKTYKVRISRKRLSAAARTQVERFTSSFRNPASGPPAYEFLDWHKKHIYQE